MGQPRNYRPEPKTLLQFLDLLVELGITNTNHFKKKEKQTILRLIASNMVDDRFDFSEALQEMLAKNLDKQSDKIYVFLRLMAEYIYYNGLLGYIAIEGKAEETSQELIEYFADELFDVFKNRIQCILFEIVDHNEILRQQHFYESLSSTQKLEYDQNIINERGVNEANFH